MAYDILQSSTECPLLFFMVQSADHLTGLTGASPTVKISKNGGTGVGPSGAVSEIDSTNMPGWYKVAANATDTNTLGPIGLHATSTSADAFDGIVANVVAAGRDPQVAVVPANVTQLLGTAWLTPGTAGTPDVNAKLHGGTSQTGRDIGASVLLSAGTGTGQLDFTSGVVKSSLVQILGTALTETSGYIAAAFKKFFNVATPTGTVNSIPDAVAGAASGLALVGSVMGKSPATLASTDVTGNIAADIQTIKTEAVTCGAPVTVLASVGTAATSTAQTGDSYAIVNGTSGPVAIKTDTAAIKLQTDKMAFTVANKIDCNVYDWNGTAVHSPGTAGIPDVNLVNIANAAVNTANAQIGVNVVTQANIDFGATQKASITTACTASTPTPADSATLTEIGADVDEIITTLGIAGAGLTGIPDSTTITEIGADVDEIITTIGVAGAGLTALGDTRLANLDATISSRTKPADTQAAVTTVTNLTNAPTVGDLTSTMKTSVENAVWEATGSNHENSGTTGLELHSAGSAGDPWSTVLPGAYTSGEAGYIVGTNLNAQVSAVKAKTDNLPASPAAVGSAMTLSGDFTSTMKTSLNAATPASVQNITSQSGDSYARLGAPAGASISADIGTVKTDVLAIPTTPLLAANYTAPDNADISAIKSTLGTPAGASLAADIDAVKTDVENATSGLVAIHTQIGNGVPVSGDLTSTMKTSVENAVWNATGASHVAAGSTGLELNSASAPSAETVAQAVWDEQISGHLGAGKTGAALNAAGSSGDPWSTSIPGSYASGTAGNVVGNNLNAKIGDVKTKTDNLPASPAAVGSNMGTVASVTGNVGGSVVGDVEGKVLGGGSSTISAIGTKADVSAIDSGVDFSSTMKATLVSNEGGGGSGPTAEQVAQAVWDESMASHLSSGSTGAKLNSLSGASGSGAITWTYTITDSVHGLPIAGVNVWVTTDSAGNNVIASAQTNVSGIATFYLDAGTIYVWAAKPGYNFSNPVQETVV